MHGALILVYVVIAILIISVLVLIIAITATNNWSDPSSNPQSTTDPPKPTVKKANRTVSRSNTCSQNSDCGFGKICENKICVSDPNSKAALLEQRRAAKMNKVAKMNFNSCTGTAQTSILNAMNQASNQTSKSLQPIQPLIMNVTPDQEQQPIHITKALERRSPTVRRVAHGEDCHRDYGIPVPNLKHIFHQQQRKELEVNSSDIDDSTNSVGSDNNPYRERFEIQSDADTNESSSSNDSIHTVTTPYEEHDGVYYCHRYNNHISTKPKKNHRNTSVSEIHRKSVIDVCSYSDSTLFLMDDGDIIKEKTDRVKVRISNNVKLVRITSYNGYMYGLDRNGKLYHLPNSNLGNKSWTWLECDFTKNIKNITHISSTLDGSHLWLQTATEGYLFDEQGDEIEKFETKHKRVYGINKDHYMDIDQKACKAEIYPKRKIEHNIYDGALSYHNEVVAIHPDEKHQFIGVAIVNWKPYFVRR